MARGGLKMPEKHLSLLEKVHSSYKQLAATAVSLNNTFEEFGKTVEEIDYALKTSNLGTYLGGPVWIQIDGQDDGQTSYWRRELGYDRIDNRWGITVRTRSGSYLNSSHNKSDVWFFTDAPHRLQVEAAEKLPIRLASTEDLIAGVSTKTKSNSFASSAKRRFMFSERNT